MTSDSRITTGDVYVLCGIERDATSDAFGQLVCPIVNLWHAPRNLENNFVTARIGHGVSVRVLDQVYSRSLGRWYVKVVSEGGYVGWVSAAFIARADDPIFAASAVETVM